MPGVPLEEDGELRVESVSLKRDDNPSRAFVLHRPDQPLDQADTPMLADRAVPWTDALRATPGFETGTVELPLLVADQIPRSLAHCSNRAAQERSKNPGSGFLGEHGETLNFPGEVIDDDGDPPAERPLLGHGEREPRGPEAAEGRDYGEVSQPDVVWPIRLDPRDRGLCLKRWGMYGFFLHEPANGRGPDLQSCSAQVLGDLLFPELRTEALRRRTR